MIALFCNQVDIKGECKTYNLRFMINIKSTKEHRNRKMKHLTFSQLLASKPALHLLVVMGSSLGISTTTLAQYPNQMQIYQSQCSQGNQYACTQLQQMYNRNNRWRNQINQTRNRIERDQADVNRINRQGACRRSSYNFDDSHCNYIR